MRALFFLTDIQRCQILNDDKFDEVFNYDFIRVRGYCEVYDNRTGEFLFRDDTSAAAKEYIRQNQRGA